MNLWRITSSPPCRPHLDGGTLCATKVTLNGDVNEAALSGAVEAATLFRLLARKQPFAGPKHK